jgi:hypothetical protein
MRPINKVNWELISRIDVGTIARTGDISSVQYLLHPVAFAKITQDHTEFFGSRGSLHAFLILQMGVDLLLSKLASIVPNQPAQPPVAAQIPPQQAARYDAKIELLNRDVKSRDAITNSLSEKLRAVEKERDEVSASAAARDEKPKQALKSRPKPESKPEPKTETEIQIETGPGTT